MWESPWPRVAAGGVRRRVDFIPWWAGVVLDLLCGAGFGELLFKG